MQSLFGSQAAVTAAFGVPRLGPAFGAYGILSIFVAAMPFVVFALWLLLRRTRFGLQLAASGEHPFAARSVGVNPSMMRLIALLAALSLQTNFSVGCYCEDETRCHRSLLKELLFEQGAMRV